MPEEPLNPSVSPLYQQRFAENTSGILAAIIACITTAGGSVTSYPSNTAGIIRALMDLEVAISALAPGGAGVATKLPMTAGESLAAGDAVYVNAADGYAYKAGNTGSRAQATVLGLVESAASALGGIIVVARGPFTGLSGLTTGAEYYLDTSGVITTTPPGGGGTFLVGIGQAISTTRLDLQPLPPVELT